MKKWGMMLLAFILLAGMTTARADSIDFAPYALEQRNYYIFPYIQGYRTSITSSRYAEIKTRKNRRWSGGGIGRSIGY